MTEIIAEFDTGHSGTIHDCQLDYYGKKLATTSSDYTIKIWDISTSQNLLMHDNNYNIDSRNTNGGPVLLAELKAHEGPVWQVSWAHPKFGGTIASCSYDKSVIIWREVRQNEWQIVYKYEDHMASVNSIEWASWEYGLQLACASSDGYISVLLYKAADNTWTKKCFYGHPNGVNAISWSPPSSYNVENVAGKSNNTAGGSEGLSLKIATGGSDNQIRIWKFDDAANQWVEACRLEDKGGHKDWVRDISWRPNIGLSSNYIVSCSEDETFIIWYQESSNMAWKNLQTISMHAPVWRVSWSATGNVLAVASGENVVTLFKEGVDGKFETVTSLGSYNGCDKIINNTPGIHNENETVCNNMPNESGMNSVKVGQVSGMYINSTNISGSGLPMDKGSFNDLSKQQRGGSMNGAPVVGIAASAGSTGIVGSGNVGTGGVAPMNAFSSSIGTLINGSNTPNVPQRVTPIYPPSSSQFAQPGGPYTSGNFFKG